MASFSTFVVVGFVSPSSHCATAEGLTSRIPYGAQTTRNALADDVPELVSELRQRSMRIQHLEARILTGKKTTHRDQVENGYLRASSHVRTASLTASLSS